MSRIRGSGTKPELMVRSLLHRAGYRFSLEGRALPGRPDILLPRYRTAVLVHGCFFHGHSGSHCRIAKLPKSNTAFWRRKIAGNIERDQRVCRQLRHLGWQVAVVWECQVMADPKKVLMHLAKHLERAGGRPASLTCPDVQRKTLLKVATTRLHSELDRTPRAAVAGGKS